MSKKIIDGGKENFDQNALVVEDIFTDLDAHNPHHMKSEESKSVIIVGQTDNSNILANL